MWISSWQFPFRNKNWKQIVLCTKQRDRSSAGIDWYYQMKNTHPQKKLQPFWQQLPILLGPDKNFSLWFQLAAELTLGSWEKRKGTHQCSKDCARHTSPDRSWQQVKEPVGTAPRTNRYQHGHEMNGLLWRNACSCFQKTVTGFTFLKWGFCQIFLSKPRLGWSPSWKLHERSPRKY